MFYLHAEIFHFNQLCRLDSVFAEQISQNINDLVTYYGGSRLPEQSFFYRFPSLFEETTARIIEGLFKIYGMLCDCSDRIPGFALIIMNAADDSQIDFSRRLSFLRYQTLEENRIWVDRECRGLLEPYVDYDDSDKNNPLIIVSSKKKHLPFLVDRFSRIRERPKVKQIFLKKLDTLLDKEHSENLMLVRTVPGTEAESNIGNVLFESGYQNRTLYMVPSRHPFDTFGPFLSLLKSENLDLLIQDTDENDELKARYQFLLQCLDRKFEDISRDRFRQDFIEALFHYFKTLCPGKKNECKDLFILVLGLESWTDETKDIFQDWLDLCSRLPVHIIFVSTDQTSIPVNGILEKNIFSVDPMDRAEITHNLHDLIRDLQMDDGVISDELVEYSQGLPIRLFHYLFFMKEKSGPLIRKKIGEHLDEISRLIWLFLYHTSAMLSRQVYLDYLRTRFPQEPALEERLYRMVQLGLLEECANGMIRSSYPFSDEERPDFSVKGENEELERFSIYLFQKWKEGVSVTAIDLFLFLEQYGPVLCGLEILSLIIRSRLNSADYAGLEAILGRSFYETRRLSAQEYNALQNLVKAAKLRSTLLRGSVQEITHLVTNQSEFLIASAGLYSDYFRWQQGHYYYTQGDAEKGLVCVKEALFSFQRNGDHYGEAVANIDLGLSLLLLAKIRPALEYFEIARRISYQIGDPYNLIRSSSFEAIAQFVYGNLSRATRVIEGVLPLIVKESRKDWYLVLQFIQGRIDFELGKYEETAEHFGLHRENAVQFGYPEIAERMRNWQARCLSYSGNHTAADNLFKKLPESREKLFFRAESAYLRGQIKEALVFSEKAADMNSPPGSRLSELEVMGERHVWVDGFSLLEGRLGSLHPHGDILYCLNNALYHYLLGLSGDFARAEDGFDRMFRNDQNRIFRPYNYLYYYYNAMTVLSKPDKSMEVHLKLLSKTVSELQASAGRFDDQQIKRLFLDNNYWCRFIVKEARKRKFM